MRFFLLPAILVAACAVSAGTAPKAAPKAEAIQVVCPDAAEPSVARLCGALEAALREGGYRTGDPAAPLRLIVEAESPRPSLLRARLVVEQGGARQAGEIGDLSVMDRAEIPHDRIDGFAKALLTRTPLPKP